MTFFQKSLSTGWMITLTKLTKNPVQQAIN